MGLHHVSTLPLFWTLFSLLLLSFSYSFSKCLRQTNDSIFNQIQEHQLPLRLPRLQIRYPTIPRPGSSLLRPPRLDYQHGQHVRFSRFKTRGLGLLCE